MSMPLALIAMLTLPIPWSHKPAPREVSHVAGWTLRVHAERFTGRLACQLSRPRIDYRRHALVFHLSARTDTAAAVYRIDNGPPLWSRDDDLDLARLGFALHSDDLDNPSGGLVRIPEQRIVAARTVSIEARADGSPARFKIDGFATALDAAHKAGCREGDFQ